VVHRCEYLCAEGRLELPGDQSAVCWVNHLPRGRAAEAGLRVAGGFKAAEQDFPLAAAGSVSIVKRHGPLPGMRNTAVIFPDESTRA
jgi:hypothetical protein